MKTTLVRLAKRYALPAVLAVGVLSALPLLFHKQALPEGLLQVNGRLEAEYTLASTEYAGKIVSLAVGEGDQVEAGQVLARLEDSRLLQQLEQAKNALAAVEKQVEAASLSLQVKRREMPLGIDQANAAVASAQAQLDKALSAREQARREAERARTLRPGGAISQVTLENAQLALTEKSHDVDAAEADLTQARTALSSARLDDQRIRAQQAQLEALEAEQAKASASVAEISTIIANHVIRAPTSGVIETKLVALGETLAPGTPLFNIVDTNSLYLQAYVPEPDIGKIKLGLKARIFTDAFPDHPFDAHVTYIASRAQFTPKEVQTQEERVKEVFAIKLSLVANPDDRLSPGMPADAVVRWTDNVSWRAPVQ